MADVGLFRPRGRRYDDDGVRFTLPDAPDSPVRYTTPGYQPDAEDEPIYRQPQTGPGPYGAPTGGINPGGRYFPRMPQSPFEWPDMNGSTPWSGQAFAFRDGDERERRRPPSQPPTSAAPSAFDPWSGAGAFGLEGYEPAKLTREHAAKSPKYAWGSVFRHFGADRLAEALKEAQRLYPQFFSTFRFDNDRLTHDPSLGALNPAFDNWTGFDVVRNFSGEGDKGLVWQPFGGPAERSAATGGSAASRATGAASSSTAYRYSPELEQAVRYDPAGRKVLDLYRQYGHTPPDLPALFEWSKAITNGTSSLAALEAELKRASTAPSFRAFNYPAQTPPPTPAATSATTSGGGGGAPGTEGNYVLPDPYGRQLESLARTRIDQLFKPLGQGPDALSSFDYYRNVFGDLQANPGYSPQERALLQTQVSEPIEARRSASKQRALERASARGFAPTSGLLELDVRDIERGADEARAVADRNLGINEIARRDQRRRQAMEVADYLRMAEEARALMQEGRYREALEIADRMQRLPGERLNLANATLSGQPLGGYLSGLDLLRRQGQDDWLRNQSTWEAIVRLADLFRDEDR